MAGFFKRITGRDKPKGPLYRDRKMLQVAEGVLDSCEYVLVVGDEAADTALFLGSRNPGIECLACEPKSEIFFEASEKASKLKNVYLFNSAPGVFLKTIESDKPYLFSRDVLFVVSAAGGGADRMLPAEIEFVAGNFQAAFLQIVGFRVPEREDFGVVTHRGREVSMKNLAPAFAGVEHMLYYPAYAAVGSRRGKPPGWALFALGRNANYEFSDEIKDLLGKPPDPE